MAKYRPETILKIIAAYIAVVLIIYLPNYDHFFYKSLKTVTSEDLKEEGNEYRGYPAGEGINSAKSLEDITANRYFIIEISKNDIVETGYYKEYLNVSDYLYQIKGIQKYTSRISRNVDNEKLAQFCVITLPSGEKCFVLIDADLININSSTTIKLPIGEKDGGAYKFFKKIGPLEGVSSEACKYFVDTTFVSYYIDDKLEQFGKIRQWMAILVFIITYVIMTKLFKKLGVDTEIDLLKNCWKVISGKDENQTRNNRV